MSDLDDFTALMERFGVDTHQRRFQVAKRQRRSGVYDSVKWTTVVVTGGDGEAWFAFDDTGKFNEMLVDL